MTSRLNEITYALIALILAAGGTRVGILLLQMVFSEAAEKTDIKKKIKNVVKFIIIAAALSTAAYTFKNLIYKYLN